MTMYSVSSELQPRSMALIRELEKTTDVEKLKSYSLHPSQRVQIAVAGNSLTSDCSLKKIAERTTHYQTLYSVLLNPNVSDETIDFILNNDGLNENSIAISGSLVPLTGKEPPTGYRRRQSSTGVLYSLISEDRPGSNKRPHRFLPAKVIEGVLRHARLKAKDQEETVLEFISLRSDLTPELKVQLATRIEELSSSSAVGFFLQYQEELSEGIDDILLRSNDTYFLQQILRHTTSERSISESFYKVMELTKVSSKANYVNVSRLCLTVLQNSESYFLLALKCFGIATEIASKTKGHSARYLNSATVQSLEELILYKDKGRKFLIEYGIKVDGLPDSFLYKLVLLTAAENNLMDFSEFSDHETLNEELTDF